MVQCQASFHLADLQPVMFGLGLEIIGFACLGKELHIFRRLINLGE